MLRIRDLPKTKQQSAFKVKIQAKNIKHMPATTEMAMLISKKCDQGQKL